MAKGVKSLKMTKGHYFKENSVINKSMVITANEEATFEVNEWHSGTLPAEKLKNLTWFWFDNGKKIIKTSSGVKFNITIPKNICGSYTYYIEASLSGKYDFKSGIYVRGNCDPKIVSSKWCTKKGGDDVRKTYTFSYGHIIHLNLSTEGLNGNEVAIEVYKIVEGGKGTKDDKYIDTYYELVINGQINLKIENTLLWHGKIGKPKSKEEFYVKVKTASGKYVTDGKDDIHGRFLRIKNEKAIKEIKPPTNNTSTKVGEPEENKKNPHKCKFRKITIYDDKNIKVDLFNEGKFLSKINPNDHFYTTREIHYDFNKWDIRADAKPILNKIADFLKENPYLPVELGSHTDCRGTNEYNMALSLKRAQAAVD
mgnify:FL=1